MKYLILGIIAAVFLVLAGTAATLVALNRPDIGTAPSPEGQCVHAAINGGTPFKIPARSYFNRYGGLVTEFDTGTITLVGVTCILTEDK